MDSKKKTFSRIGIASKGVVYLLMGALTAIAAFGLGGNKTGGAGTLEFLSEQTYGKLLLPLIGTGLVGYLFYRLYQAVTNINGYDDNTKGYIMRISYVISGLVYGFLGLSAFQLAFNDSANNSNWISSILNSEYGTTITLFVVLALIGKAIYEFYMAYSGNFIDDVKHTDIDKSHIKTLTLAGTIGFTARGIVVGILAFLFFKSAFNNNTEKVDRTDAFSFLESEFGPVIMGVVALGIATYGVFMLIKSKYPDINVE